MVLEINCKNFWFPTQSSAHVQFTSLDYCSSGKESQMSPGTFKFCNFIFISTISHQKIKKERYVHVCVSQWLNKQRHFEIFIIRLLYTCYIYKLCIKVFFTSMKRQLWVIPMLEVSGGNKKICPDFSIVNSFVKQRLMVTFPCHLVAKLGISIIRYREEIFYHSWQQSP